MKCLLSVCFVTLTLMVIGAGTVPTVNAQAMQQGVSVQLAVTNHAAPVPEADNEEAWIVTVTSSGSLYFGVQPVTLDNLAKEMKERPRNRAQKLYIKADARAPFANVKRALETGRETFFAEAVLLTSQQGSSQPGTLVPPKGLEVMAGSELPAGTVATVVEVLDSRQQRPTLKINNDEIPWSALESTLSRHFQKGDDRVVLLKADSQLSFEHVAQVIDTCLSAGAKVAVMTQGQ